MRDIQFSEHSDAHALMWTDHVPLWFEKCCRRTAQVANSTEDYIRRLSANPETSCGFCVWASASEASMSCFGNCSASAFVLLVKVCSLDLCHEMTRSSYFFRW